MLNFLCLIGLKIWKNPTSPAPNEKILYDSMYYLILLYQNIIVTSKLRCTGCIYYKNQWIKSVGTSDNFESMKNKFLS